MLFESLTSLQWYDVSSIAHDNSSKQAKWQAAGYNSLPAT